MKSILNRSVLRVAIATLAVALFADRAPADLITNGGFETNSFTGWTNSGGGITSNGTNVHSGSFAAFFSNGPDFLTQTITGLTSGSSYTLDFYEGNRNGGSPTNEFKASWDGNTLLDILNTSQPGFIHQTFTVTANNTSGLLRFDTTNTGSFWVLDDVSLNPVPEPSVLILCATGLAGICLSARRERAR